jgi:hypothetical protein
MTIYYYILDENKQAQPVHDVYVWADYQDAHKRVASTRRGKVWVSTVFLGIDHQFGDGPPLVFESMVFGGPKDQYMDRYSSYDDALMGHRRMCRIAFPPVAPTASRNLREGRYLDRTISRRLAAGLLQRLAP